MDQRRLLRTRAAGSRPHRGDTTVLEQEPFQKLARAGQLVAYKHTGNWRNMDTLRDRNLLEAQWASGTPRWKLW